MESDSGIPISASVTPRIIPIHSAAVGDVARIMIWSTRDAIEQWLYFPAACPLGRAGGKAQTLWPLLASHTRSVLS